MTAPPKDPPPAPAAPKPPAPPVAEPDESVAGEEDPGASLDVVADPPQPPARPG